MKCFIPLLLTLFSCSKGIVEDKVKSSIESNYPTAEFDACNQKWLGAGACFVAKEEAGTHVDVQGYGKGTITIKSDSLCPYRLYESRRYEDNEVLRFEFPWSVSEPCKLGILTQPEYKDEQNKPIPIAGFEGFLWLFPKREGSDEKLFISKVREDGDESVLLPALASARVVARGDCGVKFDKILNPVNGKIQLKVSDFIGKPDRRFCTPQGGWKIGNDVTFFSWMIFGYHKDYVPLSIPAVKFEDNKIKVTADNQVSLIVLNQEYKFAQETDFDFDASKENVLRILTVKGRAVIGVWNVKTKAFEWLK